MKKGSRKTSVPQKHTGKKVAGRKDTKKKVTEKPAKQKKKVRFSPDVIFNVPQKERPRSKASKPKPRPVATTASENRVKRRVRQETSPPPMELALIPVTATTPSENRVKQQVGKALDFLRELKADADLFRAIEAKVGPADTEGIPAKQFYGQFLREAASRVRSLPVDKDFTLEDVLNNSLMDRGAVRSVRTATRTQMQTVIVQQLHVHRDV